MNTIMKRSLWQRTAGKKLTTKNSGMKEMTKQAKAIMIAVLLLVSGAAWAQQATWIWYPGDFEINLANKMQNRRTERGSPLLPFWKMDAHYVLMNFIKEVDVPVAEEVEIFVEGDYYNVQLDNKNFGQTKKLFVPAGRHKIGFKVHNQAHVPSIFIKGKHVYTDSTWQVTFEDKEWIDETGKVASGSGTIYQHAGSWNLNDPLAPPSQFRLHTTLHMPVSVSTEGNGRLYDFGKETFGYLTLRGVKGNGPVNIYYGESREEALSRDYAETTDSIQVNSSTAGDTTMVLSKAFRYVNIIPGPGVSFTSADMLYEFAGLKERGDFRCNDTLINRIYDVSKYTFDLNTREFFIDGIKRDRWIWSGDAYQSYLMNYYLYFDNSTVTRTMYALRGKDPVTSHINTIMDYTFYWFLGIYDYYLYTGDKAFLQQMYPRMQSLMSFCLERRNKDGLMEGLAGDWVFIDWAEGLSKKGEVSFEQLLLCRSLETMAICADLANDHDGAGKYRTIQKELKQKLFDWYWNESKQALVHSRIDGKQTENVTRYANMFGIFFNYFNEKQKQGVKKNVLLNDAIPQITTPYMRFYELEALCALGEQPYVLNEIKDYWGGMLKLGATSFWEEYNPAKKGTDHYSMYGRKFGKSLCHAWGASPMYLLPKYYLGITPTAPGYAEYQIVPSLGGLQWMEGKVPTPHGDIEVYCSTREIRIKAPIGTGTLRFTSKSKPTSKQGSIIAAGNNQYEMKIQPGINYVVSYK